MELTAPTPESVTAMAQARLRQDAGIFALRKALEAESTAALQLVQMMNQSAGLGTNVDTVA
ncbi:MAG: YjfB family protein [Firmicutes bacterium]|nr:YjfB family protein [Bacillota bacterium]